MNCLRLWLLSILGQSFDQPVEKFALALKGYAVDVDNAIGRYQAFCIPRMISNNQRFIAASSPLNEG